MLLVEMSLNMGLHRVCSVKLKNPIRASVFLWFWSEHIDYVCATKAIQSRIILYLDFVGSLPILHHREVWTDHAESGVPSDLTFVI